MVGTEVDAVQGHKTMNKLNERHPDKTKLTPDVAASKQVRPTRIMSTKWLVARLPHKLNTDECAEILVTNAISSSCNAFHLPESLSLNVISSARTFAPMAISALEKISSLVVNSQ